MVRYTIEFKQQELDIIKKIVLIQMALQLVLISVMVLIIGMLLNVGDFLKITYMSNQLTTQ